MSRWLPAIGAGLLLAVAALVLVSALGSGAPTAGERAEALAAELRCPDCQGLSVADSPTNAAREIRRQIDDLVAAGATDAEVRAHFVDRYGEWIRLAPSNLLTWLVPLAVVLAAAGALLLWLVRRSRPLAPAPPSDRDRAAIREEVEALDA